MPSRLEAYVDEIKAALAGCEQGISDAVAILRRRLHAGQRVWVLGNGGSLAIAQHFAQDILKTHRAPAQCINDASVITAYTNDDGFDASFYTPLSILRHADDPVVVFSCSGSSRNYRPLMNGSVRPLIAIIGTDGGDLLRAADLAIHVKNIDYKICESAFSIVADMLNSGLEEWGA